MSRHWLRQWPGTETETNHYLNQLLIAYARFTPNFQGSWDWLTTKNWPNSRFLGSWSARSYVPPMLLTRSYSWILAITRTYSPLKSTNSTVAFNRQKRSWNLSSSLASDPIQLDPPLVASICRLVVIHSVASYVALHGRKSVASHSWNFYLMQTFADWHR